MPGLAPAYGMQGQASTSSLIMCRLHRHAGLVPVSSLISCRLHRHTGLVPVSSLISCRLHRHTGLVPVSSLISSPPSPYRGGRFVRLHRHTGVPVSRRVARGDALFHWIPAYAGIRWGRIRRNDGGGAYAGMTVGAHTPEWRWGAYAGMTVGGIRRNGAVSQACRMLWRIASRASSAVVLTSSLFFICEL